MVIRFPKHVFAAVLLFACALSVVAFCVFSYGSKDRMRYKELMDRISLKPIAERSLIDTTRHSRYDVKKDFRFKKADEYLCASLKGDLAELVVDRKNKYTDVIERMQNVTCIIQQGLYDTGANQMRESSATDKVTANQLVRYLEADAATYYYRTGVLDATEARLSHHVVGGFLLPESVKEVPPILEARAKRVELSLIDDATELLAEDVYVLAIAEEASVEARYAEAHGKEIYFSGEVIVKWDSKTLLADRVVVNQELGQVRGEVAYLKDEMGDVCADRFFLETKKRADQLEIVNIQLEGNVRLIGRFDQKIKEPETERLALADMAEIYPQQKEMILKAYPKERVLFFDKANGLEVSAPAVRVVFDSIQKTESIQGLGDVRFHFDESEIQKIKRRFLE